jgi:eukaryotic-like serine/threonine-protein kinase
MSETDPLGLIGRVIDGKYRVDAVAGTGGTAVVYRAQHLAWDRRVALKVVRLLGPMSVAHREVLFAQLTREAGVLASLSERTTAIVQARDIGLVTTVGGQEAPYLVLEWVDGVALDVLLERERAANLPPRSLLDAVRLLDPIAHGLALAHHHGIAHRDVKPGNIFVLGAPRSADATTKILDFGIAKVVAEAHGRDGGFRRTERLVTAFTPAYGAPEQFSRDYGSTGPWTDVFGLALVLAELTTGREAFTGDDLMTLARAASSETERPSLRAGGTIVPDGVERVFARAVAVDPTKRHADVGEFWRELRAAVGLDMAGLTPLPSSASLLPLSVGGPSSSSPSPPRSDAKTRESVRPASPSPGRKYTEITAADPRAAGVARPAPLAVLARGQVAMIAVAALVAALLTAVLLRGGSADAGRPSAARAPLPQGTPASAAPIASATPPPDSCPGGMILVPGGKFFMGSDEAVALDFERPAHKVAIGAFCIDRTEVTVKAYQRCSDQGECRRASSTNAWADISAADRKTYDPLCNVGDLAGRADHPINCVDWRMASEYCRAQDGRLPTEAEWEFAARGPDGRTYPWGDDAPSGTLLNACGSECAKWGRAHRADVTAMYLEDDGFAGTAPVGSFPKGASRYGVEDVVGNVWEWVADYYAPYDGGGGEQDDPRGPAEGRERVIRGGGWNGSQPAWVRPTFRYKDEPDKKSHGIGFRCAAAPK